MNEDADSLVRHGGLLTRFTTAVLGDDDEELNEVRRELYDTLGEAALVDAAGCVASFNAVVKVADGVGIELDEFKQEATATLREELGIRHYTGE